MAPTRPVWSGALTELMRTGTFGLGFVVAAIAAGLLMTWLLYPSPLLPGHAEVPQLRGLPYQQAVEELTAVGLRGRPGQRISDPLVAAGAVSWQSPAPFTVLPESSTVRLGVSTGIPIVVVPDLVGLPVNTATAVLSAAGLGIQRIDTIPSTQPAGRVLATDPAARSSMRAGASVTIGISRGPQENAVVNPNRP